MTRMQWLPSILLVAAFSLASSLAGAQDETTPAIATEKEPSQKDLARDLYQEGSRLYERADYPAAIAAFERAYAAYPAAALLFNLAQAHRLLGPAHCAQALDYYERYGQAPESESERAEVEVRIVEMRGCVKAAQAAQERARERAPARIAPREQPQAPLSRSVHPGERPIPTAAYVLGAVSLAGLATFGTMAILGRNQQTELERGCSPSCSPERVEPMKTKFLVADIGLAVFAVALGGAGYVVLSRPDVRAQPNSALGGAQLDFVGSF
jgi:tetratricopeptide (TPR) repeat protein